MLKFKRAVDFDARLEKQRKDEFIDLNFENFPKPPMLVDWVEDQRDINSEIEIGGSNLSWRFEKQKASITIGLVSFAPKSHSAGIEFLRRADATTMVDLPWLRGPNDLGTVSAIGGRNGTPPDFIFWFYENIFAEISTTSPSGVSVLELAKWLQRCFEDNKKPIKNK
jgi:hypothetical protein